MTLGTTRGVLDKILFIVNNLALNNFDAKLDEMKEHYKEAYLH